jgi:hypothetical protein
MKISRVHIAAMLLALYGTSNLLLFPTGQLRFEDFGYLFQGDWQPDYTLFYTQMTRWVFVPALALVVALVAFLPKPTALKTWSVYAVGATALIAFITALAYAGFVVNVAGADFGAMIFGYSGEELSLFALARMTFFLVIAALILAVLEILENFGVKLTFGKAVSGEAGSKSKAFLKTLLDASLENFISRKVSGVLYIITAWLIILSAALIEVLVLVELLRGNIVAFFGLLLVPVVTLLALIVVRMAFEAGIALIVIAENTKK